MTRPISRLLTVALTAWWVSAAHPALAQTDAVRPDSALRFRGRGRIGRSGHAPGL